MGKFRVSVDIGGTFTDFVYYNTETGKYTTDKILSTPENLSDAVTAGIDRDIGDYTDINFFVHGTTAGINAVLERKGVRVALVTTKGFKDVYKIARGDRLEMYNRFYKKPVPLVKTSDVFEVDERILYDGSVDTELDKESVYEVAEKINKGDYDAVAVVLINAYINPAHELEVEKILKDMIGDKTLSISHKIAREWREYERTSTVVLNSYVAPIVEKYLGTLEKRMAEKGYDDMIYIMQSSGGIMTSKVAKENPILTLLSGPVGGAIGKDSFFDTLGHKNIIGVDMGGTSFDVSMLVNGKADVASETHLEGFPILTPMVNIYTIGAGGGSIAWIEGGGLRVGPKSAGSNPGPACYGKGGNYPTVTDANVVLGRVDPKGFLGGGMTLDKEASIRVVSEIGNKLGLNTFETAEGICTIANSNMADVIRQITVRKGIDPKDFAIVAYGGAGPMHVVFIAEELGIETVIVPILPGTFSAWGMHQCDIRQDAVRTFRAKIDDISMDKANELYGEMECEIREILAQQKVPNEKIRFIRTADMRYVGQDYTLNIEFTSKTFDASTIDELKEGYNDFHYQVYGHNNPVAEVEIVNLRQVGIGLMDRAETDIEVEPASDQPNPKMTSKVVFFGKEQDTNIYDRGNLSYGHTFMGPAIVEELSSTSVIPPGYRVEVDKYHNLVIKKV